MTHQATHASAQPSMKRQRKYRSNARNIEKLRTGAQRCYQMCSVNATSRSMRHLTNMTMPYNDSTDLASKHSSVKRRQNNRSKATARRTHVGTAVPSDLLHPSKAVDNSMSKHEGAIRWLNRQRIPTTIHETAQKKNNNSNSDNLPHTRKCVSANRDAPPINADFSPPTWKCQAMTQQTAPSNNNPSNEDSSNKR